MRNILLIGKMGAGKTEMAKRLEHDHFYHRVAFSDPIGLVAKMLGWPSDRTDPRFRPLMQRLGGEARHHFGADIWAQVMASLIGIADRFGEGFPFVVEGGRYPEEVSLLYEAGFCPIVLDVPEDIRVARLMKRDGLPEETIRQTLVDQTEDSVDRVIDMFLKDRDIDNVWWPHVITLTNEQPIQRVYEKIVALAGGNR